MQDIFEQLLMSVSLNDEQSGEVFEAILTGQLNEVQVGALLALLAAKGVVLEEIVGAAHAMRRHAVRLPIDPDDPMRDHLIDTCGTGGAPKTFNISTCAAIVAAAARGPNDRRVHVAKHGGRSRSGRGSAEVLDALGVNVHASPDVQVACLRELGLCFSFAVNHHPAMRFAAGPRKSLGFPTIFNLLGPLTNPAGARRQLLGVYDRQFVRLMARALAVLGVERAMVVHGGDGLDEITTTTTTILASVSDKGVQQEELDPADLGFAPAVLDDFCVGSLQQCVRLIRRVLDGDRCPARDVVELNAAAALVVGDVADDFRSGIGMVREAIDSGAAARVLESLRERSHEPAASA